MTTGLVAAIRKEFTRRAQSASTQVQDRMAKAEKMLQEHVEDQKAINAGESMRRAVLYIYIYIYIQVRTQEGQYCMYTYRQVRTQEGQYCIYILYTQVRTQEGQYCVYTYRHVQR